MSGSGLNLSWGLEKPVELSPTQWYAISTRPKHEKKVAAELDCGGIENYSPAVKETHRWSDRCKVVEVPLFPGYVFVRINFTPQSRLSVLRIGGVLNFVGPHNLGAPIPDKEIENIRTLLGSRLQVTPYPFLNVGQRVLVRGGALDGLEGIFLRQNGNRKLVISVGAVHRSLAVSIDSYDIQPI